MTVQFFRVSNCACVIPLPRAEACGVQPRQSDTSQVATVVPAD